MKNQFLSLTILMVSFMPAASGQMTADQKVADFLQLAGLFARYYAPYEWKRDAMGFDLYNTKPWIERIKTSKDDLEFYDICMRYVASLQDSHAYFAMRSDFTASLPFDVDIYDGKVLIDQIFRSSLPKTKYPFNIGDELVSLDGKAAIDLISTYLPYAAGSHGNVSARRRQAVYTATSLKQVVFPRAPETGDIATIVVRDSSGAQATYVVPWIKYGTPVSGAGRFAGPTVEMQAGEELHLERLSRNQRRLQNGANAWGVWVGDAPPRPAEATPSYLKALRELQSGRMKSGSVELARPLPAFDPPLGFRLRTGSKEGDPFVSGTFPVGQHTIGFLRFASMGELSTPAASPQLQGEIAFLQANTDALVIDLMHNPGGSNCYAEGTAQYLFTTPFRGVASRLRPSLYMIQFFSHYRSEALANDAPASVIALYNSFIAHLQSALKDSRPLTSPLPICTPNYETVSPARDEGGNPAGYTKPILVLVDEFTGSAAETLAMIIQDEGRGSIFGVRTNGAGGNPRIFGVGVYADANTVVTTSMVTRKRPVSTPQFPSVDHIENVGIYPDIVVDYMTRDNLMTGGKTFVQTFSQAVADMITKQ